MRMLWKKGTCLKMNKTKPKVKTILSEEEKVDVSDKRVKLTEIETRADAGSKHIPPGRIMRTTLKKIFRTDQAALFTAGDGDAETEESLEQVEE